MPKNFKLTDKQAAFCNYYLETFNASEAYRKAYDCVNSKKNTIARKASELLGNALVQERIKECKNKLAEKSEIKKEHAVKELANIVNVRINKVGKCVKGVFIVDSLDELPDEVLSAIQSIKQSQYGIEVRLYNKIDAINTLSKMLGWDAAIKLDNTITTKIIIGDE